MAYDANTQRRSTRTSTTSVVNALFLMGILLVSFDYHRAEDDDSSLVVILNVISLVFLAVAAFLRTFTASRVFVQLLPPILYTLSAFASGLWLGQPPFAVTAISFPMFMFILSAAVVGTTPVSENELRKLLNMVVVAAILSCLWRLIFGFTSTGLGVNEMRYQIISGALPLLFSYGVVTQIGMPRRLGLVCLALALLIMSVSVTRSYVIVFAASAFVAIVSMGRAGRNSTWVKVILAFVVIVFMGYIVYLVEPSIIDRWVIRMTAQDRYGFDPTEATRLAQIDHQFAQMREQPWNLVLGFGANAETTLTGEQAGLVSAVLGSKYTYEFHGFGLGHNTFIGVIFCGGVFFGGLFLLWLFRYTLRGIAAARAIPRELREAKFAALLGVATVTGTLAHGGLAGIFNDRSESLFMGIAFGLIFMAIRQVAVMRNWQQSAFGTEEDDEDEAAPATGAPATPQPTA